MNEGLRDVVRVQLPRPREDSLGLPEDLHLEPVLVREGPQGVLQVGLEFLEDKGLLRGPEEGGELGLREGVRHPELEDPRGEFVRVVHEVRVRGS